VLNLFGLVPFMPPPILEPISIGAWPLFMGLTMFLQQKLNPQPADPIQAKVFMFMPIIFTFMLAHFAVGLVIYWSWNNLLSMAQQWVIMKRTARRPPPGGGASGTTSSPKAKTKTPVREEPDARAARSG
jgi:YidC/Oxa1 family membrane protein insertase